MEKAQYNNLRSSLNVRDKVAHPYKINRPNYSSVNLNRNTFGWQTGRQKIMHRMTASIPSLQSVLILFLSGILIRPMKLNTQLFQTPLGIFQRTADLKKQGC